MYVVEEWIGQWREVSVIKQLDRAWRCAAGVTRKNKTVTRLVHNDREVRRAEWVDGNVKMTYDAKGATGADGDAGSLIGDLLSLAVMPFVLVFRIVTSTPVLWCAGFLVGCGIGPFLLGFKFISIAAVIAVFCSFVKPRACDDAH